jgi:hypothetical protein
MGKRRLIFGILLVVVTAGTVLRAQQKAESDASIALANAVLQNDVGMWNAKMKMWTHGPDAEPIVVDAAESNTLLGKGTWLISDFRSNFEGAEFFGHAQLCFDPVKKKFVGTWIDNMTPHLSTMQGNYDNEKRILEMKTQGVDSKSGKPVSGRNTTQWIGEDRRVFMSFNDTPDGEVKQFEIEYTRKKSK